MLEIIVISIVKAITSYVTTSYLKNHYGSIDIQGAPFWYGREPSELICSSTFKYGSMEQIDTAKKQAVIKLNKKLSAVINDAIYENKKFKHLKPDEEAFIQKIINDKQLLKFVTNKIIYKNIKYDEDKNIVFVRGCVTKKDFISFETDRVKELSKELTFYKSDKAFKELNGSEDKFNDRESKAFRELDSTE
jgi:hypothetical protein